MNPESSENQDTDHSNIDSTISETMEKALSQWTHVPFKVRYSRPPFSFKKNKEAATKE